MLGIYDELISSWKMTGWKPRSVNDEMMRWGDPSGPFESSARELESQTQKVPGGKTPTNRWSSNFKPPPKPQTDVFRRVVPYIYRSIYGVEIVSGWSG